MNYFKQNKTALLSLLISVSALCCGKEIPACSGGNCDMINFSGNVVDITSNQPVSNQTIQIKLNQNHPCVICSSQDIVSGVSDKNGHFELSKKFDTSLMAGHHIEIEIKTTDPYIFRAAATNYISFDPGYLHENSYTSYSLDTGLTGIQVYVFPKTLLLVNLHRKSDIVSGREYFNIFFTLGGRDVYGEPFIMSESNKDTSLSIITSSNFLTKYIYTKFQTYNDYTTITDSIVCSPTGKNSIDITY